ncbi:hypothetical protein J8J42_07680 [Chryseobacterium sp. cx-311]|uniref:hypothetical protein n=1 Tax=Marnyiella aurantia TaxID=2758037 RepID=UPI001AE6DFA1|nr:hypothetical protein [Marnyiella aurantia]MBP0612923.1 hypothetical protein [Marnyiella aurantia]
MLELLLILLGLNFTHTNSTNPDTGIEDQPAIENPLPTNPDPGDTGGENQPIPPRK